MTTTTAKRNMGFALAACSKALLGIGGLVFFFGDRALVEFWHYSFIVALFAGGGVGIAIMGVGAALNQVAKGLSEKTEDELEEREDRSKTDVTE